MKLCKKTVNPRFEGVKIVVIGKTSWRESVLQSISSWEENVRVEHMPYKVSFLGMEL